MPVNCKVIPEALEFPGSSRQNAWKCRENFLKYAAAMILTVVASMNPEEIIIMGSDVQDGELSWIKTIVPVSYRETYGQYQYRR